MGRLRNSADLASERCWGGWLHMPVWKKARMAGLDSLAAVGMALGSVKCSSLKASLPANMLCISDCCAG